MKKFSFMRQDNSCRVAKDRLSTVVLSDRLNCTPEMVELMKQEILSVMEKYLEIDRTRMTIHLEITTKEEQGVNMLRQYRLKDYNFRLIIWVIALSVVGILVIGSAKESVQTKQIAGLILGLVVMVLTSLIDYSWVLGFYWLSYFVGIGLLAAVLLAGENVGGATRWIRVGGVLQFQPSDVVKILMIAFFAKFFSKHEEDISRFKTILIALLLVAAPTALLLKEPDLSTTIVFVLLFCAMFFVSGLSYKIVGGIIVACVPLAVLLMSLILSPDQQVLQAIRQIVSWRG